MLPAGALLLLFAAPVRLEVAACPHAAALAAGLAQEGLVVTSSGAQARMELVAGDGGLHVELRRLPSGEVLLARALDTRDGVAPALRVAVLLVRRALEGPGAPGARHAGAPPPARAADGTKAPPVDATPEAGRPAETASSEAVAASRPPAAPEPSTQAAAVVEARAEGAATGPSPATRPPSRDDRAPSPGPLGAGLGFFVTPLASVSWWPAQPAPQVAAGARAEIAAGAWAAGVEVGVAGVVCCDRARRGIEGRATEVAVAAEATYDVAEMDAVSLAVLAGAGMNVLQLKAHATTEVFAAEGTPLALTRVQPIALLGAVMRVALGDRLALDLRAGVRGTPAPVSIGVPRIDGRPAADALETGAFAPWVTLGVAIRAWGPAR